MTVTITVVVFNSS